MSNFGFVQQTVPQVHDDCRRAESYLAADPRTACFYARRAAEGVVDHLYTVLELRLPYRDDLAARINDAAFARATSQGIVKKLNLIRRLGNTAVHDNAAIPAHAAQQVVRELHHVVVWASFHHSANPAAVPLQAAFDPALAARAAPLSRQELVRLAEKFREQDSAHARQLSEKDELLAAHQAEIAELKHKIAQAQASKITVDNRDYGEAATRDLFIDVLLREAGWPLDQARDREYEVTGMPNVGGSGFVDYVLWGADGLPLALVEAKRTRHAPSIGQQQARLYADCLEAEFGRRPVIFYTNGYEHWLWDDSAGYPPRKVSGFYTADELELAIQRRRTRLPLHTTQVSSEIAGRPYQVRAIRAIGDAFDDKQRDALLVMATGSGKTRTVIALVDQLMNANWVKRVLFLADRTALVNQAVNAFKKHLPSVTTVNLVSEKNEEGRVYVSTYPTMMNLINEVDDTGRRFGPGYFDLVVIDEAHRSVYAKYGAIFEYFDSFLVGLTATPKDEVDHNTYRLFNLEDGVPTDAYSLEEAVADGYLVPPRGVAVGTKFLRSGIRYADLSEEEKAEWDLLDWGEDGPPDEVGAEELNRFLFNQDTVDLVLETLMTQGYRVAGADRLGKTIIFAKSQAHADFIVRRFDTAYPEYAGHFARVITHDVNYAQSLIDAFSIPDRAPHIAISVDMLDTGIDVPEVVNLVFFKTVRSKTKFWQMIGRGTRLCPDLFEPGQDKSDFLVFDFCGNLEYFGEDLPGREGSLQKSLSQRIFEARVGLVIALGDDEPELRDATAESLHQIVTGMNNDNFVVRQHRRLVEKYRDARAWKSVVAADTSELLVLAGLPSAVRDDDEYAKRFDLLILRRQLAQLEDDMATAERMREQVQMISVNLLGKMAIPSVAERAELLEAVGGDEWWVDVTLPMLEHARHQLRGLARFVDHTARPLVYTDFEDTLSQARDIDLPGVVPGTNMERFRQKAAAYLREHEDHIALQRLRRGRQLTPEDLAELEKMLLASGAGVRADIDQAAADAGGLGVFVRQLVGLEHSAVEEAFAKFLKDGKHTAAQVRFVGMIVDELTRNGVMKPGRLFESPYTDHAPTGPDYVFPPEDVDVIVEAIETFRKTALPEGA